MEGENSGGGRGGFWENLTGSAGTSIGTALGTYLQSRTSDPAAQQYTVRQGPGGPNLQNSAAQGGMVSGISPIAMVGIALAAVAALGVVVYAVRK